MAFYLKIGVPTALLTCFECWAFEISAFFAGMISVPGLGAHILLRNWDSLTSMIAMGSSLAASTFVGNSMGQRMPLEAK